MLAPATEYRRVQAAAEAETTAAAGRSTRGQAGNVCGRATGAVQNVLQGTAV